MAGQGQASGVLGSPCCLGRVGEGIANVHLSTTTQIKRPAPVANTVNEQEGGLRTHVAEGGWQGRTGQSTAQSGRQAPAANLCSPVLPYLGLRPLKGGGGSVG